MILRLERQIICMYGVSYQIVIMIVIKGIKKSNSSYCELVRENSE